MMENFFSRLFGSRNQRLLRQYAKDVAKAGKYEADLQALSDRELRARTDHLKAAVAGGKTMEEVLPEAFAVVREASVRTLGLRHFDVQLIGGLVLHEGKIAEMRTGEGKTLVATLPAYLNALGGDSVQIVTVNEYLAQRDADWMRPIYEFLGLTVGVIKSGMNPVDKAAAYACDVIYGTNNEFGFDYLRDNLAFRLADKAQRDQSFAIVDEVDSILIDEARTPLIISGPAEGSSELYQRINALVPKLERQEAVQEEPSPPEIEAPGDYSVDEKSKQAHLTEAGHQKVEKMLAQAGLIKEGDSLYDVGNIRLMHHLTAALRAHTLFQRDVDYIVNQGEIVIVDEFTGRTMPGRRWSDGLHQAVEAKEGVAIKEENQTVASITFQNYFRMYDKLAGMTGTADTEAFEFQQIYGLEVVVIPTHMQMIRDDEPDLVFLARDDKFEAIIEDIQDCQERSQPVLVGTTSIETSEYLSSILKKKNIDHQVLNAKHHTREAEMIIQAGRPGRVTIATNMAGRGTDIVLGGSLMGELQALGEIDEAQKKQHTENWQGRHQTVIDAGGLRIIGTERHESRRIDNQLRGRSGRQGDPGSSRFYLSLEDNLMRIFGDPERVKRLLSRVGMREGEAIESKMLSRQIERAQRKVETHNFDIRKQLLKYDDVANDQRRAIYYQRDGLMEAADMEEDIRAIRRDVVDQVIDNFVPPGSVEEQWDVPGLSQALENDFVTRVDLQGWLDADDDMVEEELRGKICDAVEEAYEEKVKSIGEPVMRHFEKAVMLQQLDSQWREHLAALDYLRQGIHLRGYAQKNPEQEYKREAFAMFTSMLDSIKHDSISILSRVQVRSEEDVAAVESQRRDTSGMKFEHAQASSPSAPDAVASGRPAQDSEPAVPFVRVQPKVGRNEPCPCGSGKKYKHCHGRLK
ncbi:MAG: preprotein translocase subunit SecA [Gammaproteobacteria bacterium]|nr:preprotein translocase subunit SecA [Gammaproteobacteria bacterium]